MKPSAPRVLLADAPHPWHDALKEAFGEDAPLLAIETNGEALREVLAAATSPYKVVIVGEGLSSLSGLDALFLTQPPAGASRPQAIFLITSVRQDTELLQLWKSRGVADFVDRDAPVEDVAQKLRSRLFVEQRVAPRLLVRAKATVQLGGATLQGTLEDLSAGGACVVVPARKAPESLAPGASFTVETELEEKPLVFSVVLRRVELRKALFGDRLALGLSFASLTPEVRATLDAILERVQSGQGGGALPLGYF